MRRASPATLADREGGADTLLASLSYGPQAFVTVAGALPLERVNLLKAGVPSSVIAALGDAMNISRDLVSRWIGIPRATVNRKLKNDERLSLDESERVTGLVKLVGQVQKVVNESGDPTDFDAAQWTVSWLETPNAALAGMSPGELMDTCEGRTLVSHIVDQMQSGAY